MEDINNYFLKKHIQVTVHYTVHIGIAPSFQIDRKNRKYHYQKYVSTPHATAALFARHLSLPALTSISKNNIPSYALPYKNGSRRFMACPHSGSTYPTRPVCAAYSVFKVRWQRRLHTADCAARQNMSARIKSLFRPFGRLDLSAQKAYNPLTPAVCALLYALQE